MAELIEQREGGVVTLTMNRPDAMNALTDYLIDAMIEAFQRLGRDPDVGVIVLTGAGRAFCAGVTSRTCRAVRSGRWRSGSRICAINRVWR